MNKAGKQVLLVMLGLVFGIGRFIYRVGQIVEAVILFLYRITLRPLGRFLRKCTPRNIFNKTCALGEWVMKAAAGLYKGAVRLTVWAAHSFVKDFSYWAPALALAGIIGVIILFQTYTVALEVTVDGKVVSYVSNEREFTAAVTAVEKNLAETLGENYCMYTPPEYGFVFVKRNKQSDEENLYAQVYRAVTEEIGHHYGLYVDGALVAAAEQQETIDEVLEELKAPYETKEENQRVEFVSDVEIRSGLFGPSMLKTQDELREIFQGSTDPQYYTIQEGDWLEDIVKATGLSSKMLYYLNPELDDRRLIPGKKLVISQPEVYLGVKVVETITYTENIAYSTTRIADSSLYVNQTKVKKAGKYGKRSVTAEVTYVDGVRSGTKILSSEVLEEPVTRELYVGTKAYPSSFSSLAGTGAFIRPINGGYVSCGFGGYRGHSGTDLTMHGAYGKPVYASAGGRVISASYSGGYGKLIQIQHSNGYVTYYAHLSAMNVSAGDTVVQGQQIGRIGSTGNSTGPHLHFELRINGKAVNAMKYLG